MGGKKKHKGGGGGDRKAYPITSNIDSAEKKRVATSRGKGEKKTVFWNHVHI